MNIKFFLFLCVFLAFFNIDAARKSSSPQSKKSPRATNLSPRSAKERMAEKFKYFQTETRKGNCHAAMITLIDLNADYHDYYSKLTALEKLRFKRSKLKLEGLTLNKWITKHQKATLDNIMQLKSVCETCEHCEYVARGVQKTCATPRRKPTESISPRFSEAAESKSQASESQKVGRSTLERYSHALKFMERERKEMEKKMQEQQKTIEEQQKQLEQQPTKLSELNSVSSGQEKIQVMPEKPQVLTILPPAVSNAVRMAFPLSVLPEALQQERRLSLVSNVPTIVTPKSALRKKGRLGKRRGISFGVQVERGTFSKDEPQTPISAQYEDIPGRQSIEKSNYQMVVAARKKNIEIRMPQEPQHFFPPTQKPSGPPSPASASIHMLMPPGPADTDDLPESRERKNSSPPPPPPDSTPPATPRQLSFEIPPPPSAPPSPSPSLIAQDSPSTIRRHNIAASLNLSMFVPGADLPPDPNAGV